MVASITGKRIAITGGAGFLGSFVVEELLRQHVLSENILVIRSRDFDLRVKSDIRRMYRDLEPEIVIHLAASVGGIGANRDNPGKFLYENLVMATELIEEGHLYGGLAKFVGIGTVCAYPKFCPAPFKEDDLWNGYPEETNAPYGLAKKMMLAQLQAYRQQYGFKGIFLLPVNLYGPRDNFDLKTSHVIPALIRKVDAALLAGADVVEAWGDGSPTREFVHARDAARGIVLATARYDAEDPVNIGSGREISIRALTELIAERMGFEGHIAWDGTKPNGQPRRLLDISRAKERFGYAPEIAFETGLDETIAWWRENRDTVLRREYDATH
jgi:GDP-L-fucose synthase